MDKFQISIVDNEQYDKTLREYYDFICNNDIEIWKPINEFPCYDISTM